MTRIELLIGSISAEIYAQVEAETEYIVHILATVDTGAQISLLPLAVAERIYPSVEALPLVEIEQAGLTNHYFLAREGLIRIRFEDATGAITGAMDALCWFTDTDKPLIGFDGILDRATLYLEMRQTRTGWMEFND
jgi:hypothetical protein